jgi:hypothetical protein
MERARRTTLSAAVFVLICFFLPWVQVSCAGFKDSESGFDLAHGGDSALWLVALLMLAVLLLGLRQAWRKGTKTPRTRLLSAPYLFTRTIRCHNLSHAFVRFIRHAPLDVVSAADKP